MRDPWFQAFFAVPPRFCGVQLLPFSVAHDYLLTRLGNPFVIGGDVDEAALFEMVQVCSHTWEENRSFYVGGAGGALCRRLTRWAARWSRKMDTEVAIENMRQYVADYRFVASHRTPAKPADGGPEHEMGAPAHWHIIGALCREYGRTYSAAWNTAFNEAKCLYDAWQESEGDDTLEGPVDMRINELCREATALYKAGDIAGMEAKYAEVQTICNARSESKKGRE